MDYITGLAKYNTQRLEDKLEEKRKWEKDYLQTCKWAMWLALFVSIMFLALAMNADAVEIDIDKIVMIESSGDPNAVNRGSGCIGLMQINPKAALLDFNYYHSTQYTRLDLFNPQINMRIGQWYITHRIPTMLRHYGIPVTIETVIASYNWGIGHVKRWHKRGMVFAELPRETQNYIKKYRGMK